MSDLSTSLGLFDYHLSRWCAQEPELFFQVSYLKTPTPDTSVSQSYLDQITQTGHKLIKALERKRGLKSDFFTDEVRARLFISVCDGFWNASSEAPTPLGAQSHSNLIFTAACLINDFSEVPYGQDDHNKLIKTYNLQLSRKVNLALQREAPHSAIGRMRRKLGIIDLSEEVPFEIAAFDDDLGNDSLTSDREWEQKIYVVPGEEKRTVFLPSTLARGLLVNVRDVINIPPEFWVVLRIIPHEYWHTQLSAKIGLLGRTVDELMADEASATNGYFLEKEVVRFADVIAGSHLLDDLQKFCISVSPNLFYLQAIRTLGMKTTLKLLALEPLGIDRTEVSSINGRQYFQSPCDQYSSFFQSLFDYQVTQRGIEAITDDVTNHLLRGWHAPLRLRSYGMRYPGPIEEVISLSRSESDSLPFSVQ